MKSGVFIIFAAILTVLQVFPKSVVSFVIPPKLNVLCGLIHSWVSEM